MLKKLGSLIEKRPWFIVIIIVLITLGFSTFIPSLEFKTDFEEFTPDDDLVRANERIYDYFGVNQQIMLLYLEEQAGNTITPQALRDTHFIQKELEKIPDVNATVSITTFIDAICQLEFGETLENCTDEQLNIAIQDLLSEPQLEEIQIFREDDKNEPVDYRRYPRISMGKTVDSADIKNCYISKDDGNITFSIEVYDLSHFQSTLKPSFPWVNVMEWYVSFENLILPDETLEIEYQITAHLESVHPIWEVGKGVLHNLRTMLQNLINRKLFDSYKKEAYLWIKPPEQPMFFPIPLKTGEITFDINNNRVNIRVIREELGGFGIAPQFGSFELPAKLTGFKAGVRYYQTSLLKLPGGRVTADTDFLLSRIEKLSQRPVLGSIVSRLLENYGDITWEDFDELFEMMDETDLISDTIALKDIESSWIQTDTAPDTGFSDTVLYIYPSFYEDLKVTALSFLSKDYEETNSPKASLIVLQLDLGQDYEELIRINNEIIKRINEIGKKIRSVSVEATGEGVVTSQINELTTEANQIIGPSIFVIIMIILFINFRKTSYVFLPMLALGISTIWLFGTMALLGIPFNVIAVALVPLILGLGVDYSVHLFHNYNAELEKQRTPAEAIKKSVKEVGTAMFLAMITTVIAFMSFLSASIPPIRDFGILLALGVTYTFITAITLLASTRYILDRRKKVKIKRKKRSISVNNIMGKTSNLVLSHPKKILIVTIIISIVMASGALQLERGFNMEQFIPADNPAVELFDKIGENFPYSSQDQEYILIEGNVATVEVLKGIAETHENLEDDTYVSRNVDGSIKSTSIYTVIQQAIENNQSLVKTFNIDEKTGIPRTDRDVRALYDYLYNGFTFENDGEYKGQFDIGAFSGIETMSVLFQNNSRYESTLIRIYIDSDFMGDGGNINDELETLKTELNDDIETYGDTKAVATGIFIIQYTITDSLTESQILSTAISVILAAFVVIIAYRNPTLGLIAMIPVGISIVWILGTMYYFGYILNPMTVTVTSITIGIGIDYAIHATERFRLVADKTGDITKAVCETISHTGGALLIAALTTTLGFGILVLAPIPPQQQFGIIISITIIYSFLTSVLVLPLFLERWAKWRKKRKGFIISPRPAEVDEKDGSESCT